MKVSMYSPVAVAVAVSSICAYTISMMITPHRQSHDGLTIKLKHRLRLKLRDNCLLFPLSSCFYSSRSSALHLTDMSWERMRMESIGIFRHGPLNFQGFFAFSRANYCTVCAGCTVIRHRHRHRHIQIKKNPPH